MIVDCAPRGWLRLIEVEYFKGDQRPVRDRPKRGSRSRMSSPSMREMPLIGGEVVLGFLCAPVIAEWQAAYRRIIDYAATKAGAPLTANLP
ncbi:hypothetical protein [Rhizobium azibense]|uniref:Uncharacterized protein n=1 Tax=Rhizobium azibense TaxID=1136135 RepID=A0A4R3RBN7_9HYPH|nr:hypothetical protein [Rhizobium azibense]TCU32818.1 hypothetical protein EV129_11840 [Rhizobium azibense]